MNMGIDAARQRTPYTRWERSLECGAEVVGAMQQQLIELGVKLIDLKPSQTATVSIATAPNFKNAAAAHNIELDYAMLATKFLHSTHRSGLKTATAKSEGVGFIKGRNAPGRDSNGFRIVMSFSSTTMREECTGINALLQRAPYRGNVHISVANVHTHCKTEQLEILECLSGLIVGETFKFNPIMHKSVGADGSTAMRSLSSLERDYYLGQAKHYFTGFGRRFAAQSSSDTMST